MTKDEIFKLGVAQNFRRGSNGYKCNCCGVEDDELETLAENKWGFNYRDNEDFYKYQIMSIGEFYGKGEILCICYECFMKK